MIDKFQSILIALLRTKDTENTFSVFDPVRQFDESNKDVAKSINAAFFIAISGADHPLYNRAKAFLDRMARSSEWKDTAEFYLMGIEQIKKEIESIGKVNKTLSHSINALYSWISNGENLKNTDEILEKIWTVFFPEAVNIRKRKHELETALRQKRKVTIDRLGSNPLSDPAQQLLITSNALLTLPTSSRSIKDLALSEDLKKKIHLIMQDKQSYWYDHPIPLGVKPENNEILYGLKGLKEALSFERKRGNAKKGARLTCVLSVSVTHTGLHAIAKPYLKEALSELDGFDDLDVYVFSESDTEKMLNDILVPAAMHYFKSEQAEELLDVFGVDGEYGRHYSFLKAIAAFWNVLIDSEKTATFKIDLDQVFPQDLLVKETGASAFEHFCTPLWGANGNDASGQPLELGMIAGALVNESDITSSVFTPDVQYPNRSLTPDEHIFFSQLPQALSTDAEMMTRYGADEPDGEKTCIQRIHITGGTNGILLDPLFRYRPFTPSFMGRAEDQAFILSVLTKPGRRLAYVHKDGFIMRHDKHAFAQEAIQTAHVGKLIGDYARILYFSVYANVIARDISTIKNILDPFTGCFISWIPFTVVFLRFALKAASFFDLGEDKNGVEFIVEGAKRLKRATNFVQGENSKLKRQYEKEQSGWNLYYDTLLAIKDALERKDDFAVDLRKKAQYIIRSSNI